MYIVLILSQGSVFRCCTQPQPLQPWQDLGGEIRQLGEIVDKVERQAVETRRVQSGEFPGYSVRITNRTVGSTRQDTPLNAVGAATSQYALRVGACAGVARVGLGQIAYSAPIGVVDDVLHVVIGFLLGRAADNAHGRPELDVATVLTRQALGLCDALDTGF